MGLGSSLTRQSVRVTVTIPHNLKSRVLEIPATEPDLADSDNRDCGPEQALRSSHKTQSQPRKAKVVDSLSSDKSNAAAAALLVAKSLR